MWKRAALAMSVLATTAAIGLAGASGAAQSRPRWQVVPQWRNQIAVVAAGRIWFFLADPGNPLVVKSAPIANGRVGAWRRTTLPNTRGWIYKSILRDDLVFAKSCPGTLQGCTLAAVRLRSDGTLGKPTDVGGAPVPASSSGAEVVQLPDRAVQVTGYTSGIRSARRGVCCPAVDYTKLVQPEPGPDLVLGIDHRGRLWMAWATSYGRPGPSAAKIVELDPSTLRLRGTPVVVSASGTTAFYLVCSDACRVVAERMPPKRYARAVVISRAPDERSATTLKLPLKKPWLIGRTGSGKRVRVPAPYTLIGAHPSAGRLDVAYWGDGSERGLTVRVARGNVRGANMHVRSSIFAPSSSTTVVVGDPHGVSGPGYFAVVAIYERVNGGGGGPLARVAILPAG